MVEMAVLRNLRTQGRERAVFENICSTLCRHSVLPTLPDDCQKGLLVHFQNSVTAMFDPAAGGMATGRLSMHSATDAEWRLPHACFVTNMVRIMKTGLAEEVAKYPGAMKLLSSDGSSLRDAFSDLAAPEADDAAQCSQPFAGDARCSNL